MEKRNKKKQITNLIFLSLSLLAILVISACTSPSDTPDLSGKQAKTLDAQNKNTDIKDIKTASWKDITLKDVNTQENYKISDFKGTPVLIESFAVWCPTCTRQQTIIKKFHETNGDKVISISLDTDPNEDEAKVLEHTKSNGFTWRYSVSPKEFTKSLIDEFGVGIVNAPSVPMILVCEDDRTRLLKNGVKSADDLQQEVANGC